MEGASQLLRIGRKSSIESEPRTLGFHQIKYARVSISYKVSGFLILRMSFVSFFLVFAGFYGDDHGFDMAGGS